MRKQAYKNDIVAILFFKKLHFYLHVFYYHFYLIVQTQINNSRSFCLQIIHPTDCRCVGWDWEWWFAMIVDEPWRTSWFVRRLTNVPVAARTVEYSRRASVNRWESLKLTCRNENYCPYRSPLSNLCSSLQNSICRTAWDLNHNV